jgi:hypothetical protein
MTHTSATYTSLKVIRVKPKLVPHYWWIGNLSSTLYKIAMFYSTHFCIATNISIDLHCPTFFFVEMGGQSNNVPLRSTEKKVSTTYVVCATPCSIEIKESSMHAILFKY